MRYRSPTLLVRWSGFLAVVWAVASSLVTYPHSLAYFNELAGGPSNGHQHLIGANLDWGQDNFLVQNWVNQHPERQPIHISQIERLWSLGLGQGCVASTTQPSNGADHENSPDHLRPRSGWHVIDVNSLHDRRGTFNWALRETPVGRIGFTQLIYFVNDENAAIMP